MKKEIKFSVVIPVYNGEKFINRSVNSIISQTYENWELIIVNDGSVDNTSEIVESVIKNNQQRDIKYIKIILR